MGLSVNARTKKFANLIQLLGPSRPICSQTLSTHRTTCPTRPAQANRSSLTSIPGGTGGNPRHMKGLRRERRFVGQRGFVLQSGDRSFPVLSSFGCSGGEKDIGGSVLRASWNCGTPWRDRKCVGSNRAIWIQNAANGTGNSLMDSIRPEVVENVLSIVNFIWTLYGLIYLEWVW